METIAIPEWINLIFDLVIMLALGGLWVLWWRTNHKQRAIESLLAEAAREIDRATLSLNEALEHIERIKRAPAPAPKHRESQSSPEKRPMSKQTEAPQTSQITQLLRMHREGQSEDRIANDLGLPSAQVKLLLKLHGARQK